MSIGIKAFSGIVKTYMTNVGHSGVMQMAVKTANCAKQAYGFASSVIKLPAVFATFGVGTLASKNLRPSERLVSIETRTNPSQWKVVVGATVLLGLLILCLNKACFHHRKES